MISQCFDLQKKGKHVQCFDELFTNIVYLENLFNKKVKKNKTNHTGFLLPQLEQKQNDHFSIRYL